MANEGSGPIERTVSFVIRLVVSLLLPGWGLAMIVMGFIWGMFWWIVTGVIFLAGNSLIAPYLGGRRLS